MIDITFQLDATYGDELENKILNPDNDDFCGVMLGEASGKAYIDYTTEEDETLGFVIVNMVKKLKQLDIKVLSIFIDPTTLDLS